MTENQIKNYEIIKRLSDTLFQILRGEKKTHSEVVEKVNALRPIIIPEQMYSEEEIKEIVDAAVELYEVEVGIKTFAPNVLVKDHDSNYWLKKVKPTIPHSYFDRYKIYLSEEGYAQKAIENIEKTCEQILSLCANPRTANLEDKKKGLVVGDVQSGKTANYLGLINMAYDYGYKIVILLAGTTNSLRIQTQKRTDKGVIGAKSDSIGNICEYIGVGFSTKDHFAVPFTNQSNDFKKFVQNNLNAAIGDFNKPVVLVVKKIKSVLESVGERLQSELSEQGMADSKSILIIDDEADNASPNTKTADDPSTINKDIRAIFNKFPVATYVGYTATPFANVFIDPTDENDNNKDLFPSDFIVQLNSPDIYFGGRKVFPKDEIPRCLRLIREEEPCFLPVVHSKYDQYTMMADSLKEAVNSFLINNVIRTFRGQSKKHRSMMVNITRFNNIQSQIEEVIKAYIEKLTNEIEQLSNEPVESFIRNTDMKSLFDLYNEDLFYQEIREGNKEKSLEPISWENIQSGLYDEIKQIKTVIINSKNGNMDQISSGKKKRFDYEEYEETGARVIAIGGMVLSRGLTLEGLMTSYYSRNTGTYDTLLQMCRWFGYRPQYEDLCRVYLTQESVDRFDAVLDAVEDLKEQFAEMERHGKSPKDYGLMVRESPDTLETTMLITARNKMKSTDHIEYVLNYGGIYADTSKLSKKVTANEINTKAMNEFRDKVNFSWDHDQYMAHEVSKHQVADLIRQLSIPWINKKFDTEGLSEYIESSQVFPYWDVLIAKGKSTRLSNLYGVNGLSAVERKFHVKSKDDPYIRIGDHNNRVLDPSSFNAGLWIDEGMKALILKEKNANSTDNKHYATLSAKDYLIRRQTPILVVYPVDLKIEKDAEPNDEEIAVKKIFETDKPLYAFTVGFPQKEKGVKITYRANKVKLEELTKELETDDDEEGVEDVD